MKTLQSNFTTPEQSKRLLELGVPDDSADCYYLREHPNRLCILNDDATISELRPRLHMAHTMPCWSVGRLVEIYVIARELDTAYLPIERGEDMVKYLIRLYEEKVRDLDFSKLED